MSTSQPGQSACPSSILSFKALHQSKKKYKKVHFGEKKYKKVHREK